MNKRNYCQACTNDKFGIKTRVAALHTCGQADAAAADNIATCPECLKVAGAHELAMFGGLCEDCADQLNNLE
jgi:hypothetical protein